MKAHYITCLLILFTSFSISAKSKKPKVWTDAKSAAQEHPGFSLQGEYTLKSNDKTIAVQATVLSDGKFLVASYQGGLPGAGWDKSKINSKVLDTAALKKLVASMQKITRISPTMGKKAPDKAIITINDGLTKVENGILHAGGKTTKEVGSFTMHIEFKLPFKPARNPSNQDRGNSGIYIFNNYEIQVIDSFALDFDSKNNPIKLESKNTQWCGCFYKLKLADINMAFPPLTWQTYDIDFTAPIVKDDKKIKNGFITVYHNGIKIHDNFELTSGTGMGARRKQLAKGPIYFQYHGNPTVFRNVWVVEKED